MDSSRSSALRALLSSQQGSEMLDNMHSQASSARDQSCDNDIIGSHKWASTILFSSDLSDQRSHHGTVDTHKWASTIYFSSRSNLSSSSSTSSCDRYSNQKWASTIPLSSCSSDQSSSSSFSPSSYEKYSSQKNSSNDQDQYHRLSSNSNLFIDTKDQQSWETADLSPGELYTYHRNNANCECGTCPACQERDSYMAKSNTRIRAWTNEVSEAEGIEKFDNDLERERKRECGYEDERESPFGGDASSRYVRVAETIGEEIDEEVQQAFSAVTKSGNENDQNQEELKPTEASPSSSIAPLVDNNEPLQAVLWSAYLPDGELFEIFEEIDGGWGFLTLNHGTFYLLPGQHIVDYVELIESLTSLRFNREVFTWDGTANNCLIA